jgi:GTP cyclohydrolase IA
VNPTAIRRGVELILGGLDIDPQDQNFKDTPDRVARAYAEIFAGLSDTAQKVADILTTSFPSTYSEIVIAKGITTFSMCPHHLLPVRYVIDIGYLTDQGGDVLGVSKLGRLAEILSHRPVLQEQMTDDITSSLMQLKGCIGSACIVRGEHTCMTMRGVKLPEATIITSSMKGAFRGSASAKLEFLNLVK